MMELLSWLRKVLYQEVDYPGGVGGQCVDLANDYVDRVWVTEPVRADAQQWSEARIRGAAYTRNTPTNYPPRGAVVVWHGPLAGLGLTDVGHVAICLAGSPNYLLTVDQNWNGKGYAALYLHGYQGVHGWWTTP